jgi:hypothetical protein
MKLFFLLVIAGVWANLNATLGLLLLLLWVGYCSIDFVRGNLENRLGKLN